MYGFGPRSECSDFIATGDFILFAPPTVKPGNAKEPTSREAHYPSPSA